MRVDRAMRFGAGLARVGSEQVAANDSSESKGKCSATQSTRDPARRRGRRRQREAGRGAQREIDESGRVQRRAHARSRSPERAPRRRRQDGRQLERERRLERRTAPLQDAHLQAVGAAGLQAEAQRRRRRPAGDGRLAQHEGGAVVLMRGELEAAQPLGAQARRQPGDDRADMAALQRLLERPQAVAAGTTRARVWTTAAPRRRSRGRRAPPPTAPPADRRTSPADRPAAPRPAPARAGGSRRRRRCGSSSSVERAARPAAAGQLGVEAREAGRHRVAAGAAELVAQPERRVQGLGRTQRIAHEGTRRLARRRARKGGARRPAGPGAAALPRGQEWHP